MSLLGISPDHPDEFTSFEEVRTVSSTGGEKGVKPQRFDLIPVEALTRLAEHYGRGAEKYAAHQWRKGYEWSKSYAALQRHLTAWWGGEDLDPEFGTSHLAAVAWHAFTLLTFIEIHPDHDDRPGTQERLEQLTAVQLKIDEGVLTEQEALEMVFNPGKGGNIG